MYSTPFLNNLFVKNTAQKYFSSAGWADWPEARSHTSRYRSTVAPRILILKFHAILFYSLEHFSGKKKKLITGF